MTKYTVPSNAVTAMSTGHLAAHDNIANAITALGGVNVFNTAYASGAAGDGSTDDTAAINAALAATPAGGFTYLPGGFTYKISGTLTIPDGVTLKGDKASGALAGSYITVANASNLACIISDSAWASNGGSVSQAPRVEGVIIDGNGANQSSGTGVGVAFCSYRGEVIGCQVLNTRGDGIRITDKTANAGVVSGAVTECKVSDNKVAGCGTGNLSSNREGIAFRDSGAAAITDFWCMRNVVEDGALTQTNGMGIYSDSPTGGIVSDNHLEGIGTHGIWMSGTGATRITGNYVEYFGQLASFGACYGIYVQDAGSAPGCHISGNAVNIDQLVTGNTFTGLYLINGGSGEAAFFSLGPNDFYTSVAAATAVSIQNQGAAGTFTIAGCPQLASGFTTPYALLNASGNYDGDMFAGYQAPAYAATMAVDLTQGTVVEIALTGNLAMDIPTQMVAGMEFTFVFTQPASGGTYNYGVTWTNNNTALAVWLNAAFVPVTGVSATSAVTFVTDGYNLVQVTSPTNEAASQSWLVTDTAGAYPVVRQGVAGPQYRSAGWNIYAYYPPEGATFTLETLRGLFAQSPSGTLFRVWAFAPVPGSFSWASCITALQNMVTAGAQYGHRFIFTLSTWGDHNELYNQTGQPDQSGNAKTVAWITSQQYLHSVYGANSLQDWVTLVVGTFANEPAVSIYDIMNEPQDASTTNVTAWATYCSTVSGWIKAIAPNALVYLAVGALGNFMGWGQAASYATAIASMDFTSSHDYSTAGFSPMFQFDGINKPQILDEHGAWAKGHYGAFGDADLDTNGLPAMSWEAQARYYELYLEAVFRSEATFAALAWSLMAKDFNGGPYGADNGTGQYEPLNQARARKVICDFPVNDHANFSLATMGSGHVLSWINSAQAFRYADGAVVYTGANSLQQQIHDLVGSFNGPGTSVAGPVCRHAAVTLNGRYWPSLQFSAVQYFAGGWQDSGSATYFMVIYPTALPTGSGGTTFGYLVAPTANVASAAVRITSTGAVALEHYSAATGGTVIATSTALLTANQPGVVMVEYVSGTSYRIDVNTVPLSGSSATTYTATTSQFGAAADGTNGFSGHLLEFIKLSVSASEGEISSVNAYLTRKYGLQF